MDYNPLDDPEISPENRGNISAQQEDAFILSDGANFEQRQQLGLPLPEHLNKDFHAFNSEIQNSNLPREVNKFTLDLVNCVIYARALKQWSLDDGREDLAQYFQDKIDNWNTKSRWLVRNYKGIGGFQVKMLRSIFKKIFSETEDHTKKGWLGFGSKKKEQD